MPAISDVILELSAENVGPILARLAKLIVDANPADRETLLMHLDCALDDMREAELFGGNDEHDPRREPPAPAEQPGPFGDDATSWYAASDSPPHGILNTPSPLMDVRLEDGRFFRACWLPRIGWDSASEFYGSKVTHYRQA